MQLYVLIAFDERKAALQMNASWKIGDQAYWRLNSGEIFSVLVQDSSTMNGRRLFIEGEYLTEVFSDSSV